MRKVALLASLALAACGGAEADARSAAEAAPLASGARPPEGWPAFPLRVEAADPLLSVLLELARAPEPLPLPPTTRTDGSRDAGALDAWVGNVYGPWAELRAARLARAGEARRGLMARSDGERSLGAALHGHLLAVTADALVRAAGVLEGEARAALRAPVAPYADAARGAFEVCYELATASGPAYDGWRRTCSARIEALPE
ncbi:MAG: hypothetical protein AAGH15_19235 [Myxococcota bacterium]